MVFEKNNRTAFHFGKKGRKSKSSNEKIQRQDKLLKRGIVANQARVVCVLRIDLAPF